MALIPSVIQNLDSRGAFIGIVSLAIMLGWPYLKATKIGKIPAPLVVLIFAVPAQLFMNFASDAPAYALVKIGNLVENINVNIDFGGFAHPP